MPWETMDLQQLPVVSQRTYENTRVTLDGVSYLNCTFKTCQLVYKGGPAKITSCFIGPNCRVEFQDAAAFMLQFLASWGWSINPPPQFEKA